MSDIIRELVCNQPKPTPDHKRYSHVVKACKDGKEKIIRFGEAGVEGVPQNAVSTKDRKKRAAYYARNNAVNPNPGFFTARYWGQRGKW